MITSEFDRFDRTSERLDVMAIDHEGKIVIIELKRSAIGTTADMQALRYAAYCSTLSFTDIIDIHLQHIQKRHNANAPREEAEQQIREFIDQPDFIELDDKPRIILAAEEFPAEMTATVLWLRSFEIDITCVRLQPYTIDDQLLIDSSVLIPLPEARDYVIRREHKEVDRGSRTRTQTPTIEEYTARIPDEIRPLFDQIRNWLIEQPGVKEQVFKGLVSYRRQSDRAWITWFEHTKKELRLGFPHDLDIDPTRIVKKTASDWPVISIHSENDVEEIKRLLAIAIEKANSSILKPAAE